MTRVFAAVERSLAPPWGPLIDLVSRVRFRATLDWALGGPGPATHAFVVVADSERDTPGCCWRLDAARPRATFTRYQHPGFPPGLPETALWELDGDVVAAEAAARDAAGTAYSMTELLNQAMFPLSDLGIPVHYASVREACICTTLTCRVMAAVGGRTSQVAAETMVGDAYPEELAQRLLAGQRCGWFRRVSPATLAALP